MRRIRYAVAMSLVVGVFVCRPLAGWNSTGHMLSALIAYRSLDDKIKLKVDEVLKAHPHLDLYLAAHKPAEATLNEWIFIRSSTWPDFVRPPNKKEIVKFHRRDWHFINFPFVLPKDKKLFEGKSLDPKQPNILTALKESADVLKDDGAPAAERAVRLAWLAHLVGDLHQPLHTSAFFSAKFPHGDQGGNLFLVRTVGQKKRVVKLHWLWDNMLGDFEEKDFIDWGPLDALANDIHRQPQLQRDKLKELDKTTFADWADESFTLAKKFVYRNGNLKGANGQQDHDDPDFKIPNLPDTYEKGAIVVARRRIALGGYRLADAVTEALKANGK